MLNRLLLPPSVEEQPRPESHVPVAGKALSHVSGSWRSASSVIGTLVGEHCDEGVLDVWEEWPLSSFVIEDGTFEDGLTG